MRKSCEPHQPWMFVVECSAIRLAMGRGKNFHLAKTFSASRRGMRKTKRRGNDEHLSNSILPKIFILIVHLKVIRVSSS